MVGRYIAAVDRAVEATPSHRNRVVDTWRVIALIVVVFGHWLAASVWVRTDGTVEVLNTLEWIPFAGWATWVVQVMPIFFIAGGYANARALERRTTDRRSWLTIRFRRLFAPAVPVILLWTLLAFVLRNVIEADLVYAGVLNATIPLWFLAVYLALVAIAPQTHVLWERFGLWSVTGLAVAVIGVDVAYRVVGVPGIGWLNLILVWGAVHQLGYWWADRERANAVLSPARSLGLATVGLGALIAVTFMNLYPVAMITIPGAGPQNVTPPTFAIFLLATTQAGLILATIRPVSRWAERRRNWRFIIGVSGFMMTIYVWHLTALSLLIAAGLFLFDGVAFSVEPGTPAWWLTRPLFYVALSSATFLLVILFGVFERDIDTTTHHRPMPIVAFGMVATIVVLSATAFVYLVDTEANITWWIPATTILASAVVGAYPARWRR
ncbi:MAG: acyltransferase [Actinomycetia bacterium]|nr:acyltransferase [Actinomycetes bacterium]